MSDRHYAMRPNTFAHTCNRYTILNTRPVTFRLVYQLKCTKKEKKIWKKRREEENNTLKSKKKKWHCDDYYRIIFLFLCQRKLNFPKTPKWVRFDWLGEALAIGIEVTFKTALGLINVNVVSDKIELDFHIQNRNMEFLMRIGYY